MVQSILSCSPKEAEKMGKCAHCGREWYSLHEKEEVVPKRIPTCPEAEMMVVCVVCFDALPSERIIALAHAQERAGRVYDNIPSCDPEAEVVPMTSTEYRLVESGIAGWVKYMKGEASEPPFDQEALAL